MPMQNLTGVPAIWGDMNFANQTLDALSEEERLRRKKKLLSAGQGDDFETATSFLFPGRLNRAGNPMG